MAKYRLYILLGILISMCTLYLGVKAHRMRGDSWVIPKVQEELILSRHSSDSYTFCVAHSFDVDRYFDPPLFNSPKYYAHYSQEIAMLRQNYTPEQLLACYYQTKLSSKALPVLDGSPHGVFVFDPKSKKVLLHVHFR